MTQSTGANPIKSYDFPKYAPMDAVNKYDCITTLVAPLLLIVALSLTLHYALHPISPMIHLTGNFSMSLPLLICSSAGAVFGVMLSVQIVRCKEVKQSYELFAAECVHSSEAIQKLIREALHCNGRRLNETAELCRQDEQSQQARSIGNLVLFPTRDGVELGGYWHFCSHAAPTVILFHGNAMRAEDWVIGSWPSLYKQLNFNVLVMEYRGYGISEGEAAGENQEMEAYFDAEAAYKFVLDQGIDQNKIVAHGLSLGGAYAAALGYFFNISAVILEQTFTSYPAVAANVVKMAPYSLTSRTIDASYRKKKESKDSAIGVVDLQTDGFNSLAKVAQMQAALFVIRLKEDEIMNYQFGQKLIQARYPDQEVDQQRNLLSLEGGVGHGDPGPFFSNVDAMRRLGTFLQAHGL